MDRSRSKTDEDYNVALVGLVASTFSGSYPNGTILIQTAYSKESRRSSNSMTRQLTHELSARGCTMSSASNARTQNLLYDKTSCDDSILSP